ncbi:MULTISPECIES: DUF3618 domain-containing protein [Streptomyces]|uniref:DUF3618 domain-containing protein n=1 Tax=Streptomyces tricolor TaxID=68277 RepID=A0ABS9JMX0_9ACTN|nr:MULTISPECIES: DUF3618 domain-containing protein [Streptomyces]MCG0066895.1 DUF3618 domain-containing protein [Streptomyces tricolor]OYP18289.1 DUF3618 domain-containing protein [Streptomyces sp. FBKL.4005]CUW27673.1 hypothetical protein TUE45_02401 [Streptomyces reticuli]
MRHRNPHRTGAKGPDELRQQIEHARSRLGHRVTRLVDRAEMKGRARTRAADLKDKAGAMTVQLRVGAAQAGHGMQDRAAKAGHLVQDRAARAGHAAQEQMAKAGHRAQEGMAKAGHLVQERAGHGKHTLRHGAEHAGRTARHDLRAPRPVRAVMGAAARHPRPSLILGAAGAAVVGAAVIWRRIDRSA